MTTKGTDNRFRSLTVVGESGTPSTPGSGDFKLYVADDGTFYLMDDTGTTVALGSGGGDITTDPAWAAKGDLIAGTANDAAAIRSVGANDTILMADSAQSTGLKWVASQTPSTQAFGDSAAEGTADTYARGDHKHAMPANPGGGGLTLLEQHTASSSAQLDFTTFISSTYDDYLIEGVNIAPATNAVDLQCKVGTGGGPTYAGGTDYYSSVHSGQGSDTTTLNGATNGGAQWTLIKTLANGANYGNASFSLRLYAPQDTGVMKYIHGTGVYHNGSAVYPVVIGGLWGVTTTLTALRFVMSSGNIASGIIRIYGVAK